MSDDEKFMRQAIELALLSEREGNLPVGAVITLDDEVVAEGRASNLVPKYDGTRHTEMETLRAVPADLWKSAGEMSIYTTLEPCLICFSAILIHGIRRIIFGACDDYGSAGSILDNLPPYFQERIENTQWLGPIMPTECDPLFERLLVILGDSGLLSPNEIE